MVNSPSRFLNDIPKHLISGSSLWMGEECRVTEAVYSWPKTASSDLGDSEPAQLASAIEELKAGDHVFHGVFGNGVVVSCIAVNGDFEVVVAFRGAGVKKLLQSYARLAKLKS